jgi:hypothetical protein
VPVSSSRLARAPGLTFTWITLAVAERVLKAISLATTSCACFSSGAHSGHS